MAERYAIKVSSPELGKHRVVSGTDLEVVKAKAQALRDTWGAEERAKRANQKAKEQIQSTSREAKEQRQRSVREAEERTKKAQTELEKIRNILRCALASKPKFDWKNLIKGYPIPKPPPPSFLEAPPKPASPKPKAYGEPSPPVYLEPATKPQFIEPSPLTYLERPAEPQPSDEQYHLRWKKWKKRVEYIVTENQILHSEYTDAMECWNFKRSERERAFDQWTEAVKQVEVENQRRKDEYTAAVERWNPEKIKHEQAAAVWAEACKQAEAESLRRHSKHAAAIKQWEVSRVEYEQKETARLKAAYKSLLPKAVVGCCEHMLSCSDLPSGFRHRLDLEYVRETKILIVDHTLPTPDDLIRVKEVKFIKSRKEFVEVLLSESEVSRIYDDVLYQICLRTIHELFDADAANALEAVVFNGWIESVDKATGKDTKGCVLSVHARKEEFQKINLARVDPKACFKALKGIGSSKLHSLTPIAPVLKINREDKRFVSSYQVAGELDERSNLAAMDWEDFEHLIRELFEKEFSKSGGEVKVTQASRDGGVDAVVFDPDPIHGGKTVIQAKRYTNTVGVAAVRELYGTVLNEGAMKGILVTTADYGPDAYEFAKGKPLVLLNGANLLHLLEKHGHKAKIDIQEAKRILDIPGISWLPKQQDLAET